MEVETAISDVVPEYLINARLGSDLVTENAMTYGQHRRRAHQTVG